MDLVHDPHVSPKNHFIPMKNAAGFTRRNALKILIGGAATAAGGAGCLADAFLIEPGMLSITREDVKCAKLPAALDGLRVALMADFHFCPGKDDALLQKVVSAVANEKPDLIALAGDFMSGDPGVLEHLLSGLEKLDAPLGVFAVMGNHDGWAGDRNVIRKQFEKAGISFLINQNSILPVRGESLAVAGTDFVWLGKPDPKETLKGIPSATPVLALVHEPDYFDTMSMQRDITLQVSGHTHGGQCRIPLIGYTPVVPKYGKKYVYGSFEKGDSHLFVTRGVGMTGPRVRFACLPELAMLTLRSGQRA